MSWQTTLYFKVDFLKKIPINSEMVCHQRSISGDVLIFFKGLGHNVHPIDHVDFIKADSNYLKHKVETPRNE